MIASREDVLRDLAWAERVSLLAADREVRQEATARVDELRIRLHKIEELRRARAESRRARRPSIIESAALMACAAIVGASVYAQWDTILAVLR